MYVNAVQKFEHVILLNKGYYNRVAIIVNRSVDHLSGKPHNQTLEICDGGRISSTVVTSHSFSALVPTQVV